MTERHRTVSRVVRILEHVARSDGGSSLQDLIGELGAPRSSVYGFVRGLVAEGYLAELPDQNRFVFGPGAHALLASHSTALVELADPVMQALNAQTGETVTLAVPVGNELTYVHSLPSSHRVGYTPPMRVRRPWWPTSAGKVFLAFGAHGGNRADIRAGIDEDGDVVERELAMTRSQGFATNIGESVTDVAAVAVGMWVAGNLVGAVSIGGPRARIEDRLPDAARLCRRLLDEQDMLGAGPAPELTEGNRRE